MKCDMKCTGDSNEICGGRDLINVYKREGQAGPGPTPTPKPAPAPTPKGDGCGKYEGCYKDYGYSRVLNGRSTSRRDMDSKVTKSCVALIFCGLVWE